MIFKIYPVLETQSVSFHKVNSFHRNLHTASVAWGHFKISNFTLRFQSRAESWENLGGMSLRGGGDSFAPGPRAQPWAQGGRTRRQSRRSPVAGTRPPSPPGPAGVPVADSALPVAVSVVPGCPGAARRASRLPSARAAGCRALSRPPRVRPSVTQPLPLRGPPSSCRHRGVPSARRADPVGPERD